MCTTAGRRYASVLPDPVSADRGRERCVQEGVRARGGALSMKGKCARMIHQRLTTDASAAEDTLANHTRLSQSRRPIHVSDASTWFFLASSCQVLPAWWCLPGGACWRFSPHKTMLLHPTPLPARPMRLRTNRASSSIATGVTCHNLTGPNLPTQVCTHLPGR